MTQMQRRTHVQNPVQPSTMTEVARQQFLAELVQRSRQAQLDEAYRARWNKQRAAVKASERKERKLLLTIFAAIVVFGLAAGVALVLFIMSLGVTFWVALALAAVLAGGGSSGGCFIAVTVVHGH